MGFPGVWMTQSESLVYRVVPKCACSTIGQILHFSDHGRFHDGDIHDAREGLHKWNQDESQGPITRVVEGRAAPAFTCVRNPYSRILSSFFDKIAGIQRNGNRYRGNLLPGLLRRYGVEVGGPEDGFDFDQIASFRRFLLFARDTIRFRKPMEPDIHWSAVSSHVSTFIHNGGRYDRIIWTERFEEGMRAVLDGATTTEDRLLTLEELAVLTDRKLMELQAAIARLEGSRSLTSAPESINPCPDMPAGGNGATMAVEAER